MQCSLYPIMPSLRRAALPKKSQSTGSFISYLCYMASAGTSYPSVTFSVWQISICATRTVPHSRRDQSQLSWMHLLAATGEVASLKYLLWIMGAVPSAPSLGNAFCTQWYSNSCKFLRLFARKDLLFWAAQRALTGTCGKIILKGGIQKEDRLSSSRFPSQ